MPKCRSEVEALIRETEEWRGIHRSKAVTLTKFDRERHLIEVLACNIRLKALRQALRIIEKHSAE
jgi:hypothetical protein